MCGCHINAGPEIGVASTKVYLCLIDKEITRLPIHSYS